MGREEDVGGFGLRVAEARGVDAVQVGVFEVEGGGAVGAGGEGDDAGGELGGCGGEEVGEEEGG